MDRQERLTGDDAYMSALLSALDGRQADTWTAIPGVIESYDAIAQTVVVQPAIMGKQRLPDGSIADITMPLLLDVPVQFPRGGGVAITFPVVQGDECLVVFSSRCIDAWWQSGGVQQQLEMRMHDLSDGFAFLGFTSQPRRLETVALESIQIRNDAGDTFIDLHPVDQTVTVTAPEGINLNGVLIDADGNMTVPGTIKSGDEITAKDGTANSVTVTEHKHGGVQTGGGQTAVPVPGT